MNDYWPGGVRMLSCLLAVCAAVGLAQPGCAAVGWDPASRAAQIVGPPPQARPADDLEKLGAMLRHSGPDGRNDRNTAIAQLLAMARPDAHRLLRQHLLPVADPDDVRLSILEALQRHLLGKPETQFGGADDGVRGEILTGYLDVCAPLWRDAGDPVADVANAPVRAAARRALQAVPVRDLDAAARALLSASEPSNPVLVLRCLADMQQTLLAPTIANYLEAPDESWRDGARAALQLLIYADEPIRTKAEFDAWYEQFGSMRYVDLVERAARIGPRPLERLRDELAKLRIMAAREFVTAHLVRTPGIDWLAVQSRAISDDPAVLDACLESLQAALAQAPADQGNAVARQAFCRALLDRFKKVPPTAQVAHQRRRALLLEVAAYLARPEEAELANEIRDLLLEQLNAPNIAARVAALRGLRRYPSSAARAALVARARGLLATAEPEKEQLQAMLDTLASRTAPRWTAPAADAPDKQDWLTLVDSCCRSEPGLELRARALVLAQTLDSSNARVPEAFGILLALVKDPALETKFRSTCLIYLEAWRTEEALAPQWVAALQALLDDREAALRQRAAESLARLPESVDPRRGEWLAASLIALRERLVVEPDAGVLQALVDCVKACGREPQMPEKAIGVLKYALGQLGQPVSAENQFRLEPLLLALAAIAADSRAERGEWLAACGPLLQHGQRQSLRLVLESHAAAEMAQDVRSSEATAVEQARTAMQLVIEAAVLKAPRVGWSDSEQLQREMRDVRTAFGALDALDPAVRLDKPQHRVLRLAVDLAAGKFPEVVQRATGWLGNGTGEGPAYDGAYRDRLRLLAAQAQLGLGKADAALQLLDARSADAAADPTVLDLMSRIAVAFAGDKDLAARAVPLFDRALRATAVEDPAFRSRLIDWMRYRLQLDPGSREATLQEAERHAQLFASPDCPQELRASFEQLRTSR